MLQMYDNKDQFKLPVVNKKIQKEALEHSDGLLPSCLVFHDRILSTEQIESLKEQDVAVWCCCSENHEELTRTTSIDLKSSKVSLANLFKILLAANGVRSDFENYKKIIPEDSCRDIFACMRSVHLYNHKRFFKQIRAIDDRFEKFYQEFVKKVDK